MKARLLATFRPRNITNGSDQRQLLPCQGRLLLALRAASRRSSVMGVVADVVSSCAVYEHGLHSDHRIAPWLKDIVCVLSAEVSCWTVSHLHKAQSYDGTVEGLPAG